MGLKFLSILFLLLLVGSVFAVPQRVVTQEQYETLKADKQKIINITGDDARQAILDKINQINVEDELVVNGKLNETYWFSRYEKTGEELNTNIILQFNRAWIALLSLDLKSLIQTVNGLILDVGLLQSQMQNVILQGQTAQEDITKLRCENDAYNYCFTTNSTLAGIRSCLNTRVGACQ